MPLSGVRGGESRYFVGGTPYEARRGDLFIFNSRVVHEVRYSDLDALRHTVDASSSTEIG